MATDIVALDKLREETKERLDSFSSRVLSDLILVGQIPAPTGEEEERSKFVKERFVAAGLEDIGQDGVGNVFARRPGTEGRKTVGVFAGLDTIFPSEVDHHYDVTSTRVIGPGVAHDSLAASALVSIAEFLHEWDTPIKHNILFVGLARCAEQADQEGMRTFLTGSLDQLDAALVLQSIGLGRLSYFSFGSLKFDLMVELPQSHTPKGAIAKSSAIDVLADAVNLLLAIELPRHPNTVLNLGTIQGGESYDLWATQAKLGAEIRCESIEILSRVEEEVDEIASHLSSYYGCQVELRKFGRRTTAGLRFNHPVVRAFRQLMKELGIEPAPGPDSAAGSLAMAAGIPTVALGLTRGSRMGRQSYIEIEPARLGLLQVILALHRFGDLLG